MSNHAPSTVLPSSRATISADEVQELKALAIPPQKAKRSKTKAKTDKETPMQTMRAGDLTTAPVALRLVEAPLLQVDAPATDIIEDEELQWLLPPPSEESEVRLEADLLANGCLSPIVVAVIEGRKVYVDGYQRLWILRKHGIKKYDIREIEFASMDEVRLWRWRHNNRNRWESTGEQIEWAIRNWKAFYQNLGKERQKMGRGKKLADKSAKLRWEDAVGQECSPPVSGDTVAAVDGGLRAILNLRSEYATEVNRKGRNGNEEAEDLLGKLRSGKAPASRFDWIIEKAVRDRVRDKSIHDAVPQFHNPEGIINNILKGDCLDVLKQFQDDTVSLFLFSPPYNTGKEFGYGKENDDVPYKEYLEFLRKVAKALHRVLRPGGRAIINLDSVRARSDEEEQDHYHRPINADTTNVMRDVGFLPTTEIIWRKNNLGKRKTTWATPPLITAMRREAEYVLVFTKHSRDKNKPCHLFPDAQSGVSDMADAELPEWTNNIWDIPAETKGRGGHPCPYPEVLVERLIKLFSYMNDWVVDPFCGTGTTTAVAARLKRRWTGIDIVDKWCHDSLARTKAAIEESKSLEEPPQEAETE